MIPSRKVIIWALGCLVVVALLLSLLHSWNSIARHVPFTSQWRAARAEAERDYAKSEAASARLEAKGNAEQIERVEAAGRLTIAVQAATLEAQSQARSAPDANEPLSDERAARLRRHDQQLCDLAPGSCGAAPSGDPESR